MKTKFQYSQKELDVLKSAIAEPNPARNLTVEERVNNGVEFFSRNDFELKMIMLESFDIDADEDCIVGQLLGSFHNFIDQVLYDNFSTVMYDDSLDLPECDDVQYAAARRLAAWLGLVTVEYDEDSIPESDELQIAWSKKIRELRGVK